MRAFLAAIFLCLASTAHAHNTAQVERCDYWANSSCLGSPTVIRAVTRAPMGYRHSRLSLDGLPYQLVAKVQELESACGSRVISAYRPGARVRGSGRLSLHAVHKAVDIQGGYSCAYAHLQSWPGGYSIDPGRVKHIHVSLDLENGREVGSRFNHWQPRHHHVRLAHR